MSRPTAPVVSLSSGRITALERDEVFVFGSNAAGKHRGGAARLALDRFGAVYGEGHGLHGPYWDDHGSVASTRPCRTGRPRALPAAP